MMRKLLPLLLAGVAAATWLAGCSSAPAKSYYRLVADGPVPSGGGAGLGVGPVIIPAYLDRPNIVLHESGHRLAVAESHRWAGRLEDNFTQVLASNLGRRLNTGHVRTYPWEADSGLRHQITVDVHQFHGNAEGEALLEATWRVYSLPDRRLVVTRSWSGAEPLGEDGYDALVAAQSRLLARFSAAVAETVKQP